MREGQRFRKQRVSKPDLSARHIVFYEENKDLPLLDLPAPLSPLPALTPT